MTKAETKLLDTLRSLFPDEVMRRRSEAVRELQDLGWSLQQIADEFGIPKSNVGNWVNRKSRRA